MSQHFIDRAIGQWRRWLECVVQQQGGQRKIYKKLLRKCTKLVYLIFLQKVADHTHPAAVWCSLEQSLIDGTVDQWPAHLRACV